MTPCAVVVLLAMPLLFIIVLGMSLGEGFGQKPDDRLRISIVDFDQGYVESGTENTANRTRASRGRKSWSAIWPRRAASRWKSFQPRKKPNSWSPGASGPRCLCSVRYSARRWTRSSFLADGVNPLFRDGVKIEELDAHVLGIPRN